MDDFIKEYWDNNADKYKCSSEVSWGDTHLLDLEYGVISKYLSKNIYVLDAGCANGFATIRHAKDNQSSYFIGTDFSENMIKYAEKNKEKNKITNVNFEVGNITNLEWKNNIFDIVYTTRVLINLPNWEDQKLGISECLRVTKETGKTIILEGFFEPYMKLNSLRNASGLLPLEEHDFNRYLKKYKLEEFLTEKGYKFENIDFSSVYYIGTRLLRELTTDYKSFEGFTNPILEDFYNLELKYSGGGFGIQQAYIIIKE